MGYWIDPYLRELGEKVICSFPELEHLDDPNLRIGYQYSEKSKKKGNSLVMADTEKVNPKFKEFMKYDFIITFYAPNCTGLDDERMMRLMYHELNHVGFDAPDDYYIIHHDLEDFRDVIDRWGVDWIRKE